MAKKKTPKALIPAERIERAILLIRGQKVLLDSDLAELYGVETGQLVRAVKRNADRFPEDFAYQLTSKEFTDLKCQIGISSSWGGRRTPPYAFSEQGVAMLSSVLRNDRAVAVNRCLFMYASGSSRHHTERAGIPFPRFHRDAPIPSHLSKRHDWHVAYLPGQ